jgi:hypothetical protein
VFQNGRRVHLLVGGAIGLNLILGAGVAMGVMPRPVHTENAASVRALTDTADTTPEAAAAPEVPADTTTVPPETTVPAPATTAAPKVTAAPTTAPAVTAPPATNPPTTPPPTAAQPATAPRANPTDAQVVAAMQLLKARIPLLPVNAAYGRQFGDAVCSAFDQGNNFSQVKTMAMQAVSQIPFIKITTADADFAVRTAVSLFCPGYASKLV